MKNHRWRC